MKSFFLLFFTDLQLREGVFSASLTAETKRAGGNIKTRPTMVAKGTNNLLGSRLNL